MSTGSRALPLACKLTRSLPGDAIRLVRECLRVHVGERCPEWIDDLLLQHQQGLRWYEHISMTVCAIRHVNPAICHDWTWLDMSSSDEDDEDAQVTVELRIHSESYSWSLMCERGSTLLHDDAGYSDPWARQPSIIRVLEEIRRCFARGDAEPGGTMEVPSSLQEWRSFVSLWLFSEAPAPQATLAKWLRPASDNGELCHECGKPTAPDQKHSVRGLDRAFCSQRCAAAYTVLSCRICRWEPMVTRRE